MSVLPVGLIYNYYLLVWVMAQKSTRMLSKIYLPVASENTARPDSSTETK